jgi:hypothetical protein
VQLAIATNGAFTFPGTTAIGTAYKIAVVSQPTGAPAQNCTVANASGSGGGANIDNVSVVCANIARFAYVSSGDAVAAGRVSGYLVDSQSGALLPMTGSPCRRRRLHRGARSASERPLLVRHQHRVNLGILDRWLDGLYSTLAGSPWVC